MDGGITHLNVALDGGGTVTVRKLIYEYKHHGANGTTRQPFHLKYLMQEYGFNVAELAGKSKATIAAALGKCKKLASSKASTSATPPPQQSVRA